MLMWYELYFSVLVGQRGSSTNPNTPTVYWVRVSNTQKPAIRKKPAHILIMSLFNTQLEAKIAKTSAAIDADPRLKGVKAAAKFGVPYFRLMARRLGRPR